MLLRSARVLGFEGFSDSGLVELEPGINLIIGQNNSGKSAFLRALRPDALDHKHRSKEAWQEYNLPLPEIRFRIELSGEEVKDAFLRLPGATHYIPIPRGSENDLPKTLNEFLARSSITFDVKRVSGGAFEAQAFPSYGEFTPEPGREVAIVFQSQNGGIANPSASYARNDSLPTALWSKWNADHFYFAAQRPANGRGPFGEADRLNPNANNLPSVLNTLYGKRRSLFDRLVGHMREIFPTIGNISVPPIGGSEVEVRVWPTEEMEIPELSFPLDYSGTGVSQVLSLLTAIMTVNKSVIIIDEINSFLHPAAVKSLIRIIQTKYSDHQFIISTHAPEVIGFANPKTAHLVRRTGYASTIERLDLSSVDRLREVAGHLGVAMADVFAADCVIWVEGQTEELCFPYLYSEMVGEIPRGVVFTSVVATGDFNRSGKRTRRLVYEVYSRLSSAVANLPVAAAFSFDSEALSQADKVAISKESKGAVHFLPRRNFECYLLDCEAIAALIWERDELSQGITATDVRSALVEIAGEKGIKVSEWKGVLTDENWLTKVDGARLISLAVGKLTDNRVAFSKTSDSLFLARHIVQGDREKLRPLANYLKSLMA